MATTARIAAQARDMLALGMPRWLVHRTVRIEWKDLYALSMGREPGLRVHARCPTCGALLVVEPCIECRIRALTAQRPRPLVAGDGPPLILGLELKPEHRARYEEVRAARLAAIAAGEAV